MILGTNFCALRHAIQVWNRETGPFIAATLCSLLKGLVGVFGLATTPPPLGSLLACGVMFTRPHGQLLYRPRYTELVHLILRHLVLGVLMMDPPIELGPSRDRSAVGREIIFTSQTFATTISIYNLNLQTTIYVRVPRRHLMVDKDRFHFHLIPRSVKIL